METLKFTVRIMRKRPLRSLLTIFQMALGVWIVAVILSLNLQATGSLNEVNQTMGESLAKVSISQRQQFTEDGTMRAMRISTFNNLHFSDLERLEQSEFVETAFVYENQWERPILVNNTAYTVTPTAEATFEYQAAMGLEMIEGGYFTKADQEQKNKVVLISEVISKQLFPNQSAIGKTIDLGSFGEERYEFEIIGVYKEPSPFFSFFISPAYLIFPLGSTNRSQRSFGTGYNEIIIKSKPGEVYAAVADAEVIIADRSLDELEVQAEYFQDTNRFFAEQIKMISIFLGIFAFISILISAIGILSIMLVSVVERTKEIGLRQALGASKGVIIGQILNESFVFSLLGGFIGLFVAYFTADGLINLLVQEVVYPKVSNLGGLHPLAALISLGLAIVVGQIFGFYPALQAAKMPPVEAIRDS